MTVGYGVRCKVCNCEQRAEAESKHEQGVSLRVISSWLKDQGVDASVESVRKHMSNHFAVRDEVARRYQEQSEFVMEEAVTKRLSDIELLDENIMQLRKLRSLAAESVEESLTKEEVVLSKSGRPILDPQTYEPIKRKFAPAKPIVDLLNGSAAEFRQSLKLKAELLGQKEPDGATTIIVGLPKGYEDDGDS